MTGVLTKTVDAAQGRIQGRGVGCLNPPLSSEKNTILYSPYQAYELAIH